MCLEINCASSWQIDYYYIEMHGQRTIKKPFSKVHFNSVRYLCLGLRFGVFPSSEYNFCMFVPIILDCIIVTKYFA
jgi:hypothetical protein